MTVALRKALSRLEELPAFKLRTEWEQHFRTFAPRLPAHLLRMGIAYRMQEKAVLQPQAKTKRLRHTSAAAPSLSPGSILKRKWNGADIEVLVKAEGFIWNGRLYRSLSAVARAITGTAWSGPRIFGIDPNA